MKIEDLKGCFANVNDDELLRENGLLYAENKRLHSIIKEVREYIEQPDNIQSVAFCKDDGKIMNLYKIDGYKSLELLEILDKANKEE